MKIIGNYCYLRKSIKFNGFHKKLVFTTKLLTEISDIDHYDSLMYSIHDVLSSIEYNMVCKVDI